MLFPAITALYVADARRDPAKSWDTVLGAHKYAYPATFMFLFFLSGFWFRSIHRGFVKKVLGAGDDTKKAA